MLDQHQQSVVDCDEPRIAAVASAGGGKTRCLQHRVARLVRSGVPPSSILTLTFTRRAAAEIKQRVIAELGQIQGQEVEFGTVHAVALRLLRRYGDRIGYRPDRPGQRITVCDEDEQQEFIDAARGLSLTSKVRKKDVDECLWHYNSRADCSDVCERNRDVARLWNTYRRLLIENNCVDFGGILAGAIGLLEQFPEIRSEYHERWKHVMLDEAHDSNRAQWRFLELIDPENLFVVFDAKQCQPAGTMVRTIRGYVPIERLRTGDLVHTWKREFGSHVYREGRRIRVGRRKYTGFMFKVTLESGMTTTATSTHKFLARWDRSIANVAHCVYVMKKYIKGIGGCYRMGWCKLLHKHHEDRDLVTHHYSQRCRLEQADEMWLVEIVDSRRTASIRESILATKYNIPVVMFRPIHRNAVYTDEALRLIHADLRDVGRDGFARLCVDYGIDPEIPFYVKQDPKAWKRLSLFKIPACNLRVGMKLPVVHKVSDRGYSWENIVSVERFQVVNKPVWSLDVEKHHAYIADGICVYNSIYGWNGADYRLVMKMAGMA